jgi:hypothetical protein
MARYKFLLDNDVRHLETCFPSRQTRQLEDLGLDSRASDEEIVEAASVSADIIVTNNRRDFEQAVANRIAASSKKALGCTQVHGLVIVLPSEKLAQERAIQRASRQLRFRDKNISWKEVNERCLKVVIEESGKVTIACSGVALTAHLRILNEWASGRPSES